MRFTVLLPPNTIRFGHLAHVFNTPIPPIIIIVECWTHQKPGRTHARPIPPRKNVVPLSGIGYWLNGCAGRAGTSGENLACAKSARYEEAKTNAFTEGAPRVAHT